MCDLSEEKNVKDLMDEHEDTQDALATILRDAQERERRTLDILHEQNKAQAAQIEYLKSLDDKMTERTKARDRTIYALLALLAGVLYAAGLFVPVEIPLIMGVVV